MGINQITGRVLDAFIRIRSALGPGLFESVYEEVGAYELNKSGLYMKDKKQFPLFMIISNLMTGSGPILLLKGN